MTSSERVQPIYSPGQRFLDIEDTTLDIGDEIINQNLNDQMDAQDLDGQLTNSTVAEDKRKMSGDYNQLDEPILDTLIRDLVGIYSKMKIIALPLSSYDIYKVVLRGWDLWGPLVLCTFLAFNLHNSTTSNNQTGLHFADVFVLVWFGSCVISLNYRLLSLSSVNNQTVTSMMGDARNPTNQETAFVQESSNESKMMGNNPISSQDNQFHTLLSPPSIFQLMCVFGYCLVAPCFGLILLKLFSLTNLFTERVIVGMLFGFAWPTFCSIRILIRYQHPEKRALAIYPIGLFYFVLTCMIILNK